MQISEYLIQQSREFNERVDGIEEIALELKAKLDNLEYNISRVLRIVEALEDSQPLNLPKGEQPYDKYLRQ